MSYNRLVSGIILNTLGNLVVNLFGILIGIAHARYLGPEALGTFFLLSNIPNVLANFLSFGFNQGLNRFLSELKASGRPGLLPPLIGRVFLVRTFAAFLAVLAFSAFANRISGLFGIEIFMTPRLVILLSVWIFLVNLNSILTLLLQVDYEQVRLNLLNIVKSLVNVVLVVVLILSGRLTVENLVVLAVFLSLMYFSVCSFWSRSRLRALPYDRSQLKGLLRRFAVYSLVLYGVEVIGFVLAQHADIYFIGYFLTPVAVSFYLVALNFSAQLYQSIGSRPTAVVLLSSMVEGYGKAGAEQVSRYLRYLLLFTALYAVPIMVMGAILSEDLVLVVYGEAYLPAAALLVVFLVVHFLTSFGSGISEVLKVLEKQHYFLWTKLIAALNIPLFILLLPRFELKGAVLTTAATQILTFCVETSLVCRMIKVGFPLRKAMKIGLAGILAGAVVLLTGLAPIQFLPLQLAVRVAAGCLVYAAVILRSNLFEPEALKYFPPLLRRLFSRPARTG